MENKVIIVEGMDSCLKDTIIQELKQFLDAPTHVLHYSKPPSNRNSFEYQKSTFYDLFLMLGSTLKSDRKRNIICNRAHLGETVYGKLYRNASIEDLRYIFDIENALIQSIPKTKNDDIILVLIIDSDLEELVKRDDGKSLAECNLEFMKEELIQFKKAFTASNIKNKILIDLSKFKIKNSYYQGETSLIDIDSIIKQIKTNVL